MVPFASSTPRLSGVTPSPPVFQSFGVSARVHRPAVAVVPSAVVGSTVRPAVVGPAVSTAIVGSAAARTQRRFRHKEWVPPAAFHAGTLWSLTVSGRLAGCPCCFRCAFLGCDALPAMRTSVMFVQPCSHTGAVKPVVAWQNGDFVSDFHIIHTDGAFGFAVASHHGLVSRFLGQRVDCRGWGRAGGAATAVLFHQLRYHAVQGFLCVHSVSMGCVGRVHYTC